MPPHNKPIEDIDLPELLLEVLLAIWTFIADIAIALWSSIRQAFWAIWTWPPFATFRNDFAAALIALWEYAVAHPLTTTALVILAYIVVPGVLDTINRSLLYCLGFRRRGMLRGAYAANYQSINYGGNVPRGTAFARFQSQGARGGNGYHGVRGTSPSWD